MTTMEKNIKVIVEEIDSVTGPHTWESTIEGLKSWDLTEEEIQRIHDGESVKAQSPNGRRWITIKKA